MTAHEHEAIPSSVGLVERQLMTWDAPLPLESGAHLGPITVAYEIYGQLNAARDNAILLLHALSGDAHAAGRYRSDDRKPGWWDMMVGAGRPFDTERYCVICSNVIGGCQGSTGPSSINPATGQPYATDFPVITIGDMVRAQVRLIDALGIRQLHAVAGGSMGGFQALEWATAHSARVRKAVVLASAARSATQTIAWNSIGRRAIMRDPRWRNGRYYGLDTPSDGLAIARMIGHITYLSEHVLEGKFARDTIEHRPFQFQLESEFEIENYLDYQGEIFNARFDANSYLYITKAMDYWDLARQYGSLEAAFAGRSTEIQLLSFSSDWLYPPSESRLIAEAVQRAGGRVLHHELQSAAGHDAFLVDHAEQDPLISDFLGR